ncbi:riboflavin synthase, alpha subunit [Teredinibacter turnerae T7901]|uniref:Riboflavin synthase n=1 Tax=Teredinibacter turnerae (strain ATCC 39867 / T7901) TaxID=377629 RepID=C5BS87_TERTT|nr:riboflavin synthase [Teredinibacter turnerae]ACR11431.1 riboflavin synthase, alpha subunit [Teredinibacter turnerae T7901]
MFTGIIETVGQIVSLERRGGDVRLRVRAADMSWSDVALGDSIATNGVCLTAVELPGDGFAADVSLETLSLTSIGSWKSGTAVNLEKALTPQSRLGGHIVSGHVDGLGEVVERAPDARSERFSIRAPRELAKYIAHKGSITVDGTSLTVNKVNGDVFELNIVPHTIERTIIGEYTAGTQVNLEVDVIARYLERLLLGEKAAEAVTKGVSESFLAENGYLK